MSTCFETERAFSLQKGFSPALSLSLFIRVQNIVFFYVTLHTRDDTEKTLRFSSQRRGLRCGGVRPGASASESESESPFSFVRRQLRRVSSWLELAFKMLRIICGGALLWFCLFAGLATKKLS